MAIIWIHSVLYFSKSKILLYWFIDCIRQTLLISNLSLKSLFSIGTTFLQWFLNHSFHICSKPAKLRNSIRVFSMLHRPLESMLVEAYRLTNIRSTMGPQLLPGWITARSAGSTEHVVLIIWIIKYAAVAQIVHAIVANLFLHVHLI